MLKRLISSIIKAKQVPSTTGKIWMGIIFVSAWIAVSGDIDPVIAGARRYEMKKFMIVIVACKIA
jgi:hypothetical protein